MGKDHLAHGSNVGQIRDIIKVWDSAKEELTTEEIKNK